MELFRVFHPSPLLAPYVKQYWLLKTAADSAEIRTVPTGMTNLVFHRGNRPFSLRNDAFHPRAFLCGQERTFSDLRYHGQVNMISVVFRPAGARAFFDLPVDRSADLCLSASDLEDKDFSALEASLTNTQEDDVCILLIERFLLNRLSSLAAHNLKRIESTIDLINSGQTNVSCLASAACLSTKQFDRVFSEYVGARPKEFSRTVRFQRALHLLETVPKISFTRLAFECGYFDQSHLIKEFRAFSGYTPGEYLFVCSPHSDYFS